MYLVSINEYVDFIISGKCMLFPEVVSLEHGYV